jgi:hypothetical protein
VNQTPTIPDDAWEWMWAPYDAATYTAVLDQIAAGDVVLEIGAGDFRLARQIAQRARRVYAIEREQTLLDNLEADLPGNCTVIAGDARWVPFPHEITAAVLLMRHCTHLAWYWNKLVAVSCPRLITNARWGMGVEVIDLTAPRYSYQSVSMGWYACSCGSTGFVPGQVEQMTQPILDMIWEVNACSACFNNNHSRCLTVAAKKCAV